GAKDMAFRGLASTLADGMPEYEVVFDTPGGHCDPVHRDARLVLVNSAGLEEVRTYMALCRGWFPASRIGLVVGEKAGGVDCSGLISAHLVDGIILTESSPEVWLAILGLLVCGGEYCPPSMLLRNAKVKEVRSCDPDYAGHGLTPREG